MTCWAADCGRAPCMKFSRAAGAAGGFAVLSGATGGGNKSRCSGSGRITRRWNMALFRRAGLLELGGDPRQLLMVKARGCRRCAVGGKRHPGLSACGRGAAGTGRRTRMPGPGGQPQAGAGGGRKRRHRGDAARRREVPKPSAALTRWQVESVPSSPMDDDWGNPVFDAELVRHRLGGLGRFLLTWNPRRWLFRHGGYWRCGCRAFPPTG